MSSDNTAQFLQVLEALKQASQDLQQQQQQQQHLPDSPAIKALLELETESDTILSTDPNLSTLSEHLRRLKALVESLNHSQSLRSFLTRRSISRLAASIESEIQGWIDRQTLEALSLNHRHHHHHHLLPLLSHFQQRLSHGFDRPFQDLLLKFKIFSSLQSLLFDPKSSDTVRDHAARALASLIRFNKDVFVGQVLMGPTIQALVSMSSLHSIEVLCSLISSIRSPFVDEIESNGEIPKIIALLNSQELQMKVLAMDCVLEIGYYGRKEAVDAMLKEGLVKKLVELQRSEMGGDLIDLDHRPRGVQGNGESGRKRFLESHPFASCVARFAVQLEIGEGLRQREKRAFKREIVLMVREASLSDAEAATIVAEVLWGSSP